ncbi:MAG: hypothetical protein ACRDP4_14625 [Nocardioidaceae bacterium]
MSEQTFCPFTFKVQRSHLGAIAVAIRCSRRLRRGLRIYRCPGCHAWHLTSMVRRAAA